MSPAPGGARLASARAGLASSLRNTSLIWRLVVVLVVLLVLVILLSTIATSVIMRRYLVERTVAELQTAAAPVASRVLPQYLNRSSVIDLPSSYVVVFMEENGRRRATMAPEGVDPALLPAIPALAIGDSRVQTQEAFAVGPAGGSGPSWIAVAGELGNDSGTYAVATSLAGVEETINRTVVASFALGLLVVAACVVAGWMGFRRAFRPLRAIEDTASAIAAGDLTRRVPEHASHDEVQSLARSLNMMLAQIEQSFRVREASQQRMRRFVTDASHELRTPLATVRGYAELYRQGAAATPEQTAAAMARIEQEATRMTGLVEDLLTLARLDDERPMSLSIVDLTVLAADAVQDARVRVPGREIRLLPAGNGRLAPTDVVGDEARLRQVVTNLVANALSHTPEGTPIEVAVGRNGDLARLEVRDHGPGIPPDIATKVFERFFRDDPARGRKADGGYGLGLAIVAAIVEAHNGRVGIATTGGGGATFVVELPAAARPQDDPGDDPPDVGMAYAAFAGGQPGQPAAASSRRMPALLHRGVPGGDHTESGSSGGRPRSIRRLLTRRPNSPGGTDA